MKLFFSYCRRDAKVPELQSLKQDLKNLGIEAWIDEKEPGGIEWWKEVLHQIRHCDVFLLAVTADALDSRPCQAELGWARANGRTVLPVRVHPIADWNLGETLGAAQVLDYTRREGTADEAVKCVMDLRAAIEHLSAHPAGPPPEVRPEEPEVPFPIANKLETYVRAKTLTLHKQEEFLRQVRLHRDDVDADRLSLVEVLSRFRKRPDIAVSVYRDLDGLIDELGGGSIDATGEPPALPTPPPTPVEEKNTGAGRSFEKVPAEPGEPPAAAATPDPYASFSVTRFDAPHLHLDALAASLVNLYEEHKLEAQTRLDAGRVIVQCRSTKWSRRMGAGAALTVVLEMDSDVLVVRIGGAKWLDKAAAGAIAWFIAWPAIIPAAIGGRLQVKLPKLTLEHIEKEIPILTHTVAV